MATGQGTIVLVTAAFPVLSETFIVTKFLGLLERGWDVHVVCVQTDAAQWAYYPELQRRAEVRRRVHLTRLRGPRWLRMVRQLAAVMRCAIRTPRATAFYLQQGRPRFGIQMLRRLSQDTIILSCQPDLIHFEFGPLAIGRMYLKELLGCKVVVSFRGYDLNFFRLEEEHYYQEVWDKADALHLLGQDLWQRAQKRGCPVDKFHVLIPPAVNSQWLAPGIRKHDQSVGTHERPVRILSVGRLVWKKGYEYALQAIKYLTDVGLHCEYRIVGEGEYAAAVSFARAQLGLETVVSLLGDQPPTAVRTQLLWADVFLHAAVSEGFGNAVLEAQAMGVPVVCTDADGLPENVSDGETGFVMPRRDPQALAEKLVLLAHDGLLRQQLGQAGRQRALTHFRLEDQIAAFERLYRQMLSPDTL